MKNVKSGERVKFTAQQVNAWNKAAEAHQAGKFQSLETPFSESHSPVVITIQNKTGEFAGIFSVLALGSSVNLVGTDIDKATPDAINKDVTFEGNKPRGDGAETVCITLSAAGSENITQAVLLGAVGCAVDVTDTGHRYAVPISGNAKKLQSSESGIIRILNPVTETGEQFCYVLLGGGGAAASGATWATVILPICRAINPKAKGDWACPFENVLHQEYEPQTRYNSRTHYAAQTGFVAVDGKSYYPKIAFVENEGLPNEVVHYYKNLRVSRDVAPLVTENANAHYTVVNFCDEPEESEEPSLEEELEEEEECQKTVLQRPVIVYDDGIGNEWQPWIDGIWETTTDVENAWLDYDIAACPTLDYSEVLVPGERVKVLRTETHNYYQSGLIPAATTVTIVEPPGTYTVEFEGTADVHEFGIWHKERKLTNNKADVVKTTIDAGGNIGAPGALYDYWGFDTVELLPNGLASWNFIKIAAFAKLVPIQNPENSAEIDNSRPSRPILTDTVNISNTACNTHAYGLFYKTDRDGVRYPILCNVESLTFGTCIETRKKNCYADNGNGECVETWHIFKIKIEREMDRLLLPDVYCAVNCAGASSDEEVVTA